MANEVTNVSPHIEIQNNIWTLTKHVAHSVNQAAGKVDAKVYGPIVKEHTVQLPPQPVPPPADNSIGIGAILGMIVGSIILIGVFILWFRGDIKGRDFIGF